LVTGFRKPDFGGFKTLAKAEEYMEDHGVEDYKYEIKQGQGKQHQRKSNGVLRCSEWSYTRIREYY
jgi:hypothetical protein